MEIALVTDELSADPQTAIELGVEWGVRHYELRGYFTERVPAITAYQRRRLHRLAREHDVVFTAVSPGLFKFPFPADAPEASNLTWMEQGFFAAWENGRSALRRHMKDLLPASIEFAGEVGAKSIIAFSFHRAGAVGGPAPAGVIEALGTAAEQAEAAGLELLIETEEGFWADTGARTAALVSAVGCPALRVNWDPANSFCEGDTPYPEGYHHVRPLLRNVHFKDARRSDDGTAEFVEDGQVDWPGQIQALVRDGYAGSIAIEPHLEPRVPAVRRALTRLRKLIAASEAVAAVDSNNQGGSS